MCNKKTFSSADVSGFNKASEQEAEAVLSNSSIKLSLENKLAEENSRSNSGKRWT